MENKKERDRNDPLFFEHLFLLQCVDERDHLPDLFIVQDAGPGWHGCAWPAGGNAPKQIVIADLCRQFGKILWLGVKHLTSGTIAVTLHAMT